ncbi:MAG: hypothetical protein HYZ68_01520 [Chloroflexi bacterium]|nr:hypothetical protein [Chloroflexota bacterium]
MIPSMLLKKLYLVGSLRNTREGFAFALKNILGEGHIIEFEGLQVDGHSHPSGAVRIRSGQHPPLLAADISKASPLPFPVGVEVHLEVEGEPLGSGLHEIVLRVRTQEVGPITLNIRDAIS